LGLTYSGEAGKKLRASLAAGIVPTPESVLHTFIELFQVGAADNYNRDM
jgi:hypothetical protein